MQAKAIALVLSTMAESIWNYRHTAWSTTTHNTYTALHATWLYHVVLLGRLYLFIYALLQSISSSIKSCRPSNDRPNTPQFLVDHYEATRISLANHEKECCRIRHLHMTTRLRLLEGRHSHRTVRAPARGERYPNRTLGPAVR